MNTRIFDEYENETEEITVDDSIPTDTTPTTKLERRRRIEDLFEERRLKEELSEFA